jgi:hypothetical protein
MTEMTETAKVETAAVLGCVLINPPPMFSLGKPDIQSDIAE